MVLVFGFWSPIAPAADGQVACWKADGTAVDPIGAHTGVLEGDATYGLGYSGAAFSYSGHGSVTVPSHPDLQLQRFTILAWVYPTLLDGHVDIILNKESTTGPIQYEIGIRGSDHSGGTIPYANLAFFIGGISGLPDDFLSWVDGHAAIPLNAWTQVALTFDGSTAVTYVNGGVACQLSHYR